MKKNSLSTAILILVFLAGLSLLLYPSVSDYWNSFHSSKAIVGYAQDVAEMDDDTYKALWEASREYNAALLQKTRRWRLSEEEQAEYNSQLAVSVTGVMGYLNIPKIDVNLPIYHGTSEIVLQMGVGHIAGSSLPVGGAGTHTALSGHRGLPSAKLLTHLDKLSVGDSFTLNILDEVLTYEVDQVLIVEPKDLTALAIAPEQDYCTLVTCTPYGINTHRLLVRGHRVETQEVQTVRVTADAMKISPMLVAPLVATPMLLALMVVLLVSTRRKKKQ